jgi:uncharacterized membrane protein
MLFATLIGLHTLAAIVWVGGMFFMLLVLRPSTQVLEPADRLALLANVFPRFFTWVWISIATILATGYLIVFVLYGGFANTALHVHIMNLLGLIMIALFAWLYFVPFKKLRAAMETGDKAGALAAHGAIRMIVTVNLILGLATSVIGAAGAYWG